MIGLIRCARFSRTKNSRLPLLFGEGLAALCIGDVRNPDGTVKAEIRLDATQTKGKHARTVFVNDRLRKEIGVYLRLVATADPTKPLFRMQKRSPFSENTLCQTLNAMYRGAGLEERQAILADVASSRRWRAKESVCVSWRRSLGTKASRRRRPISM
jgi:hypothetical protein